MNRQHQSNLRRMAVFPPAILRVQNRAHSIVHPSSIMSNMSTLASRLRAVQMPQEAFQSDPSQWSLAMLRQERVAFGTKHLHKTFEEV